MIGLEPADKYDGDHDVPHTYEIIKHDSLEPCRQEFTAHTALFKSKSQVAEVKTAMQSKVLSHCGG